MSHRNSGHRPQLSGEAFGDDSFEAKVQPPSRPPHGRGEPHWGQFSGEAFGDEPEKQALFPGHTDTGGDVDR